MTRAVQETVRLTHPLTPGVGANLGPRIVARTGLLRVARHRAEGCRSDFGFRPGEVQCRLADRPLDSVP